MHYLIDGHNLIAHHPDIELADPHDEVKLVLVLRSWVAASQKRRVTLYFDGGLPGGRQAELSGGGIEVVFAPAGQQADSLLIQRIKRVRNPREFALISSDRQIVAAAQKRLMPVISAQAFAGRLAQEREERQAAAKPAAGVDPAITSAEVQEWLELFGPVPEREPVARKRPGAKEQVVEQAEKKRQTEGQREGKKGPAGELKTEGELSDADVAAWLELFGGEPETSKVDKANAGKRKKKKGNGSAGNLKAGSPLSDEDLAAWQEWLGLNSD